MPDRLAALLEIAPVGARIFHAGTLCGINDIPGDGGLGQLHLVRRGSLEVMHGGQLAARISEPSILLYPRPFPHRFIMTDEGADLACANLRFLGGERNPIASALPAFVCLPLASLPAAGAVPELLFEEAFSRNCGREAVVDRLFEVVLIQVLRQLMEAGLAEIGMLAGMADPRLSLALVAMHEQASHDWTLELLAARAGMSRSAFAGRFRERVGCTPLAYLQRWRIGLAQRALERGRALKLVAAEVGYGSEAALSRAFKACLGMTPREWRRGLQGGDRPTGANADKTV